MSVDEGLVADTIEKLLAMTDLEFRKVVNSDTRSTEERPRVTPEMGAALRSNEVIRRWFTTLLLMHKDLESQFAAKTADNRAKILNMKASNAHRKKVQIEEASFETWRAGALRVKSGLEARMIEARFLLSRAGDYYPEDRDTHERKTALGRVAVLEDAIRRHRDSVVGVEKPTEADEALWAYVATEANRGPAIAP